MDEDLYELTDEQAERLRAYNFDPTDAALCTCGHAGMPRCWHMNDCPLNDLRSLLP